MKRIGLRPTLTTDQSGHQDCLKIGPENVKVLQAFLVRYKIIMNSMHMQISKHNDSMTNKYIYIVIRTWTKCQFSLYFTITFNLMYRHINAFKLIFVLLNTMQEMHFCWGRDFHPTINRGFAFIFRLIFALLLCVQLNLFHNIWNAIMLSKICPSKLTRKFVTNFHSHIFSSSR